MSRSQVNFENDLITLFYRFSIVLTLVFLIRDTLMYPNYAGIIIELSVIATNIIILLVKDRVAIFRNKYFTFLYFIVVVNLSWLISGYSITNVLIFLVIGMGTLMLFPKPVSFLYLALTMLNFVVNFLLTELSDDLLMDIKKLLIVFPVTAAILFMDFIKSRYVAEQDKLSQALEELKHRDQILKNREKKYRLLAENSHDFIVQFNADYSIEYISPSVSEILGYKNGQIYTSRNPLEMIHREDLPGVLKKMSSKSTHLLMVFRIRRSDGQFIWLETTSARKFDENGDMISSVVNCRDVSDRVSFEQKLQESEEKFRFIV
ncbi:MAG: PAS domain S-box protein, partial [Bacteroidota bacterium]